jgi:hypothetical protein
MTPGSTLMWEAKAAPGRAEDLVAWAVTAADPGADIYSSADGRVVVIDRGGHPMPDAPPDLLARPPHVWPFRQVAR